MIYDLLRYEAKKLTETGTCQLVFDLPDGLNCDNMSLIGTDKTYKFHTAYDTEPSFPTSFNGTLVRNAGRLWNFAGDGTHCSEIFFTPNNWAIGEVIKFQQKFNYMNITATISLIDLIRHQSNKSWFWIVTLTLDHFPQSSK